jgi:HK97 family phage portal protein
LLPKGIEQKEPIRIENDKAQMLESRKYQRTVIAGAFGVPPHLVGDLERATFNNVEQQDADFTSNVVQPVATAFEAAMERDLLTEEDYRSGIIIRFNLDSILRADFKSRQEGSRIQREGGMLSANEWREREGMNPIPKDKGGDDYIRPANMTVAGEQQEEPNNAETESTPRDQEPR